MTITIAFTEGLWDELASAAAADTESAAVILAGVGSVREDTVLLAREVVWVPPEHYLERSASGLTISSQGYVPALSRAAASGATAVFFHTHPGGNPSPSRRDAGVDSALEPLFRIRTGQSLYGSFILAARGAFSGRVVDAGGAEHVIERVRVIGRRLVVRTAGSRQVDDAFDRQIRAFGREGQAELAALRVGVVGAGGTGSAAAEQLIRLGIRDLLVVDDDRVSTDNLTRIHESGMSDVGAHKVSVVAGAAARIGLGSTVRTLSAKITDRDAAMELRRCDVVFGCTDDNRGRAILSRLAYWYLIPVIDMAFVVDTSRGKIRGLFGRVTTVITGSACLLCRGRIDTDQLRAETLAAGERERLAAEGYVPGLGEPDPAVGAYTTMTAAFAVNELLDRLIGYGRDPAPDELLIRLHDRELSSTTAPPNPDHYCGDKSVWGRGDTDPFLEQLWT